MRSWFLLVVACSSAKTEEPPKAVEPAPPVLPTNAATRHIEARCGTASRKLQGSWVGTRPFDDANPLAHRGPTKVTIDEKLHYTEGVGAAALGVDLQVVDNRAAGSKSWTENKSVIIGEDGARPSTMVVARTAEIAICVDEHDRLHVARRLTASGSGIQSRDESDVVVLQRAAPPPPPGLQLLADKQHPRQITLGPREVVWTSSNEDVPITHTLRSVAREGAHGAGPGQILAAPIGGGKPRMLMQGRFAPGSVLVDGGFVYVEDRGLIGTHGRIGRFALSGR